MVLKKKDTRRQEKQQLNSPRILIKSIYVVSSQSGLALAVCFLHNTEIGQHPMYLLGNYLYMYSYFLLSGDGRRAHKWPRYAAFRKLLQMSSATQNIWTLTTKMPPAPAWAADLCRLRTCFACDRGDRTRWVSYILWTHSIVQREPLGVLIFGLHVQYQYICWWPRQIGRASWRERV